MYSESQQICLAYQLLLRIPERILEKYIRHLTYNDPAPFLKIVYDMCFLFFISPNQFAKRFVRIDRVLFL